MCRSHIALRMAAVSLAAGWVAFGGATSSLAAPAQAESIVGRVIDPRGSVLPGVVVTAIAETGGIAREAKSGSQGTYRFADLPDGTYRVDFDLAGFDLIRRNHVRVRRAAPPSVDVTLPLSGICQCIVAWDGPGPDPLPRENLRERMGQVVDEAGRPLPHARLEIVSPVSHEVAYADREGRFRVRVLANQTWPLTARDSGFGVATQQISGITGPPLVLRLPNAEAAGLPDLETFARACRCGGDLFTHPGR